MNQFNRPGYDLRDLKAAIDTTRRALDAKAFAEHVAQNNNAFMGEITDKFARALNANAERDRDLRDTSKTLQTLTTKFASETSLLAGLASRLEERDTRSKWDWVTLAAGMAVAAALAGGGAFYFAQAKIKQQDFHRSIQLIAQDDDARWCGFANAPIIQDRNDLSYCAIAMPELRLPQGTNRLRNKISHLLAKPILPMSPNLAMLRLKNHCDPKSEPSHPELGNSNPHYLHKSEANLSALQLF